MEDGATVTWDVYEPTGASQFSGITMTFIIDKLIFFLKLLRNLICHLNLNLLIY